MDDGVEKDREGVWKLLDLGEEIDLKDKNVFRLVFSMAESL